MKAGLSVAIFEKERRAGGVINSHNKEGFLIESGSNTWVISWPEVAEFFEELHPVCKLATTNPNAKRCLIWKGKSFLDYTVNQFVSGIYAGKPDYLAPWYARPKLYNLEQQYGSFIIGSLAKAKGKKNNPHLKKP